MDNKYMKKIITAILLINISTNIHANEVTICNGIFASGQPVRVKIDWDNKTVDVNKFKTSIESVISYGIITTPYLNKLDKETFSIIGYHQKIGTFVSQQQIQYGDITTTNIARLSCNKSFYKTFTDRMLDT